MDTKSKEMSGKLYQVLFIMVAQDKHQENRHKRI